MADLYHFATKEDTYANYFIHVSPRPGSEVDTNPGTSGTPCKMLGRTDLFSQPWGRPSFSHLSSQLMEIQAEYHRKSLSSLDTALAELKENHGQAGGNTDLHPAQGMLRSLHSILKGNREPRMSSSRGGLDYICDRLLFWLLHGGWHEGAGLEPEDLLGGKEVVTVAWTRVEAVEGAGFKRYVG